MRWNDKLCIGGRNVELIHEDLILVTFTGLRQKSFTLAEHWIKNQSIPYDKWIVIDDCEEPTEVTLNQEVHRVKPYWKPDTNTLARNVRYLIDLNLQGWVFFIEDDDWYHPEYLKTYFDMICANDIKMIGQKQSVYYSPVYKTYHVNSNIATGSLFQTAVHSSILNNFNEELKTFGPYFDVVLWNTTRTKKLLFPPQEQELSIGVKGLPSGRIGIGRLHKKQFGIKNREYFLNQIGEKDYQQYKDTYPSLF